MLRFRHFVAEIARWKARLAAVGVETFLTVRELASLVGFVLHDWHVSQAVRVGAISEDILEMARYQGRRVAVGRRKRSDALPSRTVQKHLPPVLIALQTVFENQWRTISTLRTVRHTFASVASNTGWGFSFSSSRTYSRVKSGAGHGPPSTSPCTFP